MPGEVKIWWHDGAVKDIRYHDIPVVAEPELAFESFIVSGTAVSSGPAPANATVAIVEITTDVRYTVRPPGDTTAATIASSKPILSMNLITEAIGVSEGYTISFIET